MSENRWTDRLLTSWALRLPIWFAVLFYVFPGYFDSPFHIADYFDEHHFFSWAESNRITLLKFHQIPVWNPYWCGGTVGVAAPEDSFFSPDTLLQLAFGVAHGRRLALCLFSLLGLEGMYRLARHLQCAFIPAIGAAIAYATLDQFSNFVAHGAINFLGLDFTPWVCLAFLKGLKSREWRIVGGVFLAWMLLCAGTYSTPFTLIALALFGLFEIGSNAGKPSFATHLKAVLASGLTIGIIAFLLAAVKLVPMLSYMSQFPRVFVVKESFGVFDHFGDIWTHYAILVVLTFAGATIDRRAGALLGASLLAYTLMMGEFHPLAPFSLLKKLPLFGQLRNPERYAVLVVFFLSLGAARFLTRVQDFATAVLSKTFTFASTRLIQLAKRTASPRLAPAIQSAALGLATIAMLFALRTPAVELMDSLKISTFYTHEPARSLEQPFHQTRGNRRDGHIFPTLGLGSLTCISGIPVPESPRLRGDLAQEEYAQDPAIASVTRRSWTPNQIELAVDASAPATIYVNQNYDKRWRASVGRVRNEDLLLTVDVPAGHHTLTLTYVDWVFRICGLVSLVTLMALGIRFAVRSVKQIRGFVASWNALPRWPSARPADATNLSLPTHAD